MPRHAFRFVQTALCYLKIRTRSASYLFFIFFAALAVSVFIPKSSGYLFVVHPASRMDATWLSLSCATGAMFFFSLVGFYFLRGILSMDARYRTNELLDASLSSYGHYVAGRFAGGLVVLLSAWLVLTLSTGAICLLKFTSSFLAADWLLAFAAFLPNICLLAAASILFDSLPGLRGGLGAIAFFALWIVSIALGISGGVSGLGLATDLCGITTLKSILSATYPGETRIGMQWIYALPDPSGAPGASFRYGALFSFPKLASLVLSVLMLSLAALSKKMTSMRATGYSPRWARLKGWLMQPTRLWTPGKGHGLIFMTQRLLIAQMPLPWTLAAVVLAILCWVLPQAFVSESFLSIVLLWPILLFSQIGCHGVLSGVASFTETSRRAKWLPWMDWLSGVLIALALASGFVVRLSLAGQAVALASCLAGILFIPSLAFLLGQLTKSERPFQIVYLVLWYIGPFSGVAALNYLLTASQAVSFRHACLYLLAALALLSGGFLVNRVRSRAQ